MVRISFEKYLERNLFEKNENSILKYYRRYDFGEFDKYIDKMKFVVNKKAVDKKQPLYYFQER